MRETVRVESRPHGVVLAGPLARSGLLGIAGAVLVFSGWPYSLGGAAALALAAVGALRAVWRWERTRILVTDERLVVLEGTLQRREAAVPLERLGAVEVRQSLLGRMLDYGTVVAGDLEVQYVPRPRTLLRGRRS
jgi:membrane protein YdbS with pleckstrin-like domain